MWSTTKKTKQQEEHILTTKKSHSNNQQFLTWLFREALLKCVFFSNLLSSFPNFTPLALQKEFLDKTSVVFDDTREDNMKEKLALERKEKAEYAKKVGQFTMQVDWLKKI